jgi:hypothetical protein
MLVEAHCFHRSASFNRRRYFGRNASV